MRNVWLVAVREFLERVRNRGFIISSIAVPVLIMVIWVATGVFDLGDTAPAETVPGPVEDLAIGYVDQAGLIASIPAPFEDDIALYPSVDLANTALRAGEVDAYYLLTEDYLETGEIRRVSLDIPSGRGESDLFTYIVMHNLLQDQDPQITSSVQNPFGAGGLRYIEVGGESDDGSEEFSFTPFLVTFLIIMPLFVSGSYLLQSLGEEKSSKVMELLLVSLRPRQLLAGKLLGLGALTAVQYFFWILVTGIALVVSGQDISQMAAGVNIALGEVAWILLFALGGFVIYASFMAGLGALAPNLEGGRSWVLLISIPMMIPIYLWLAIVENPHGILAVSLSMIPFTSSVAMLMRLVSTTVPLWQVGLSLGILFLTGVGVILLMARLFRVQTLLSGEDVSIRRFWNTITQSST